MRAYWRQIVGFVIVGALFLLASYVAMQYADELAQSDVLAGAWGKTQYVLITIFAVVVAPVSTLPLVPVATTLWGPFASALLSMLGWCLGACIAYELARGVLRPFLSRHINLTRAERMAHVLLGKHGLSQFGILLLLRASMPVDALSYAIGLLVPMKRSVYYGATIIGIAPFSFIYAYAAGMPLPYQLLALALAGVMMGVGVWRAAKS